MLLGRENETSKVADLLAQVREGWGATLVLTGDPGIGKTALLQYLVDAATDFEVVELTGIESEFHFSFQLLSLVINRLDGARNDYGLHLFVLLRDALNAKVRRDPSSSRALQIVSLW